MDNPKFDINPHVIRQLGAELVTDPSTALMELVKNSYDADADFVKITINTKDILDDQDLFYQNKKGYIIIEDNGFGMDKETILNSWLIISYSNKRAIDGVKPKTPKGRTPLGDKGLGRLSTQKLAQICEIYTKKEKVSAIHVGFDWDDFDNVQKLHEVDVEYKETSMDCSHGTKLVLSGIMDENYWQGKNLEQFKALICKLISPYKELRPFKVYLFINGESVDIVQEMDNLGSLNIAQVDFNYKDGKMSFDLNIHMRILIGNEYKYYTKFILSDDGKRFLKYLQSKTNCFKRADNSYWLTSRQEFSLDSLVNVNIFDEQVADPGDFFGKIQEFYYTKHPNESEWWTQIYTDFNAYKSFVQNQVGIRIYRNGFAVKPYGISKEEGDWLDLKSGQTSNSSFYGLRPGNVIGYVAIDEAVNNGLIDKTDREGLIENDYYRNFYKLMAEVIQRVNLLMEILRRNYNDYLKPLRVENNKIQTLQEAISSIREVAQQSGSTLTKYSTVKDKLKVIKNKVDTVVIDSKSNIFEDTTNSTSVQTLREVSSILAEADEVLEQAYKILKESTWLEDAIQIIQPKLDTLEEQLENFSELASLGLISEMVSHDLGNITNRMLGKSLELENNLKKESKVSKDQIYSVIDFIKMTVASLKTQMKHLDSSMKYSREKKETFLVGEMIFDEEVAYYSDKLKEYGITIECDVESDFSITMNKGKLIQVLDNLINNSIYWLNAYKHKLQHTPTIRIVVSSPWIYFEDNGLGIDPTVESVLFDPFVTMKPKGEGRGLGLFIIRQLLDSIKCDIFLDDNRNEHDRLYRFSINLFSISNN